MPSAAGSTSWCRRARRATPANSSRCRWRIESPGASARARSDAQDGALRLVGGHVEQSIRPLLHIADALVQTGEQGFAPQLLELVVEQHAIEAARARHLAIAQAADEQ